MLRLRASVRAAHAPVLRRTSAPASAGLARRCAAPSSLRPSTVPRRLLATRAGPTGTEGARRPFAPRSASEQEPDLDSEDLAEEDDNTPIGDLLEQDPMEAVRAKWKGTPEEFAAFQREVGGLDTGPIEDPELEERVLKQGLNDDFLRKLGNSLGVVPPLGEMEVDPPSQPTQHVGQLSQLTEAAQNLDLTSAARLVEHVQRGMAEISTTTEAPSVYRWFRAIRSFAKEHGPERADKELAAFEAEHKKEAIPLEVFSDIITAYVIRAEGNAPNVNMKVWEASKIRAASKDKEKRIDFSVPVVQSSLARADSLLRRALSEGLKPERALCQRVVSAIAKHVDAKKSEALADELSKAGIAILPVSTLAAFARLGKLTDVERVAEKLKKVNAKAAELYLQLAYGTMVMRAAKKAHWDSALTLLDKISAPANRAKASTYVVHEMARAGESGRADALLTELEKNPDTLDAMPYISLAVVSVSNGNVERGRKAFDRMKKQLGSVPPLAYAPVIASLAAASKNDKLPAATREAASGWCEELKSAAPSAEELKKFVPIQPQPKAEDVAKFKESLQAIKDGMPSSLKEWMKNPKAPLNPAQRRWLAMKMQGITPDPALSARLMSAVIMQERAEKQQQ